MEVSGEPQSLSTFSHPTKGWVGLRARLDVSENRKTSCPCWYLNSGSSTLVSTPRFRRPATAVRWWRSSTRKLKKMFVWPRCCYSAMYTQLPQQELHTFPAPVTTAVARDTTVTLAVYVCRKLNMTDNARFNITLKRVLCREKAIRIAYTECVCL